MTSLKPTQWWWKSTTRRSGETYTSLIIGRASDMDPMYMQLLTETP
jgi:hypothetical protein